MVFVKKFKAQKQNKRYRKNQDIWIRLESPNHLRVVHKWRGKGRYVEAVLSVFSDPSNRPNPIIGDFDNIKLIEVDDAFAEKHHLQKFTS